MYTLYNPFNGDDHSATINEMWEVFFIADRPMEPNRPMKTGQTMGLCWPSAMTMGNSPVVNHENYADSQQRRSSTSILMATQPAKQLQRPEPASVLAPWHESHGCKMTKNQGPIKTKALQFSVPTNFQCMSIYISIYLCMYVCMDGCMDAWMEYVYGCIWMYVCECKEPETPRATVQIKRPQGCFTC